ncbi:MAG: tyrosine recombinase XerC [Anaerolineales bacterium]
MLPEIQDFQRWLRRKAPHTSTHIHYTSDVVLFFAQVEKPLAAVTVNDVDVFIEICLAEGHARTTVNHRLAALRAFYHFLGLLDDHAPANPVRPKRHFIRPGERLPRDVQDVDLQRLFALIENPRDRAMFLLMLRCGLRVGEVRQLSMQDLYLDPAPGALPRLWLHGKGGKERVVYLASQPLAALRAWLAVRPATQETAVFLNRFGKRLTVTGIQDRLAGYCRQAELWVTCHQFRHTFGRHLTEARVPVTSIQRLLGHARLRTTEVYLHVANTQVQADYDAAMQQVQARLTPAGGAS